MKYSSRFIFIITSMVLWSAAFMACSKPKEGKVVVTEQEFFIRQDAENSWVLDAKGKVKNIGQVDVKNVTVTGYCRSCGEIFTMGAWYISDYEKTPDQKAVIVYLPVGAEAEFSFTGVAFFPDQSGKGPDVIPEKLECEIVSFEPVDK